MADILETELSMYISRGLLYTTSKINLKCWQVLNTIIIIIIIIVYHIKEYEVFCNCNISNLIYCSEICCV
jgi:hypothetical protein